MVVDARTDMDPDVIREEQRRFTAVQSTVREIEAPGDANRLRFVKTNLRRYPFPEDGSAPFVLFHVTPQNRDPYFQLQGSVKPDDYGTEEQLLASIEESFRVNMNDPFFVVRRGRLAYHREIRELHGQGGLGSASAIEAVMEAMNTMRPAAPAAPPETPVAV